MVLRRNHDLRSNMFFVGYSTLQPEHLRIHSVVATSPTSVFNFKALEWCDKPFWANTITCKIKSVLSSKQPGFLVNPSICLALQEAKKTMNHGVCNASEAAARREKQFNDICNKISKDFKYESPFITRK